MRIKFHDFLALTIVFEGDYLEMTRVQGENLT